MPEFNNGSEAIRPGERIKIGGKIYSRGENGETIFHPDVSDSDDVREYDLTQNSFSQQESTHGEASVTFELTVRGTGTPTQLRDVINLGGAQPSHLNRYKPLQSQMPAVYSHITPFSSVPETTDTQSYDTATTEPINIIEGTRKPGNIETGKQKVESAYTPSASKTQRTVALYAIAGALLVSGPVYQVISDGDNFANECADGRGIPSILGDLGCFQDEIVDNITLENRFGLFNYSTPERTNE